MHVGVADSPDGPFRLVQGEDKFAMPYAEAATLLKDGDRGGIDAEVFMDDDGQAYVFWGRRFVAKLADDMMTVSAQNTSMPPSPLMAPTGHDGWQKKTIPPAGSR